VRDLVEWKGTTMDVTERAQAGIELEKAFDEIQRPRDQLHDENVVLTLKPLRAVSKRTIRDKR
jgi:hypothetical protein